MTPRVLPCSQSARLSPCESPPGSETRLSSRLTDKALKDYSAYRSSLLFWALVDLIYNMFKVRQPLGAWLGLAGTWTSAWRLWPCIGLWLH